MKKLFGFLVASLLAVNMFFPVVAEAKIDFRSGEELDLTSQSFEDDLMAAGAFLTGDFQVNGDAFVAGSMVGIGGVYGDDLNVVGSQVDISGKVADDLRVAGGDVSVDMEIDGNLLLAGGQVVIADDTVVEGDAYVAGGNVMIGGHVMGDLYVTGGRVVLDGLFDGNVVIDAEEVKVDDNTEILGNFDYTSTKELDNTLAGQVVGDINFTRYVEQTGRAAGAGLGMIGIIGHITDFIVGLIMLLVVGLVLVLLAPGFTDNANSFFIKKMGWSLLIGLVAIIVWVVVSVFLLFTIIGIPLAIISFALFGIALYVAKVLAGFSIGSVLIGRKKTGWATMVFALVLGLLVYEIITVIPLIGWIFNAIFVCTAVGAMLWFIYDLRFGQKLKKPAKAKVAAGTKSKKK